MVDVLLVKQRIEPGMTDRAVELLANVEERSDDVLNVLRKEGVYTESAFVQRTSEGDFVVYYIEAENGERVYDVFEAVTDELDRTDDLDDEIVREFNEVMDGGPYVADVEFLYHLVDPERP